MKRILLMLLILSGCGKLKQLNNNDLNLCINGDEDICQTLPDALPVTPEIKEEEEVQEEVTPETSEELSWTPSLKGTGDVVYSNMLYVNKFNLFLFNFKSSNVINDRLEIVFQSTNHRNIPNVGKSYARAYFKNGHKMRFEIMNSKNNKARSLVEYDWTLHTGWTMTVNNNNLNTVLKSEEEALDGVKLWSHNINVKVGVICEGFLWFKSCRSIWKIEPIYIQYYYE